MALREAIPAIIGGTIKRQFRSGALLLLALARSLPQHKRILIKSSISTAQLLCVCVCIKGAAVASLRQQRAALPLLEISETNAVPFVPWQPGDFLTSANIQAMSGVKRAQLGHENRFAEMCSSSEYEGR
jgi:hypothetical protein